MGKFYLSVWLRSKGDAAVSRLPKWFFRAFLKTFKTRPELAERAGFHVHPRTFDSPLPRLEEIDREKLKKPRSLPGIDLRVSEALATITRLCSFRQELEAIPYERCKEHDFWFNNETFTDFDAAVLYSMIRHLKPQRYVEVGCGYSSVMSSLALRRNHEQGHRSDVIFCDPEPRLPAGTFLKYGRFIEQRIQDVSLDVFTQLQRGDILFIDTSHVVKVQSDVEHELLRILPCLEPGVWIHIHDIFTPYDYPEDWIYRPVRLAANEQYAVECLLSGGSRYEIELPVHYLARHHLPQMHQLFPRGKTRGQSLWLRKVQ
jgi:methyltransferase family protein